MKHICTIFMFFLLLCTPFNTLTQQKTRTRQLTLARTMTFLMYLAHLATPAQAVANETDLVPALVGSVVPLFGQIMLLSTLTATAFRSWMGVTIEPEYCTDFPVLEPPTIDDEAAQKEDHEQLIPLIRQYAPILYFHTKESYFPIHASQWCTGPDTKIMAHDGSIKVPGNVTMSLISQLFDQYQTNETKFSPVWYFDNPSCALHGANPADNSDEKGDLTTPCYVITSQDNEHLYIQYLFLYGFNQPYDLGPFAGDIIARQNAHEADLEHMTLEFDIHTRQLQRIFYAAHGTREGMWLMANATEITYEGTRPVAYVAQGAHGVYPQIGTYVRLYGLANDVTSKGKRWNPKLIRLYLPDDGRFKKETMAWSVFPGDLGKRGVSAPMGQQWYAASVLGDIGKPADEILYCAAPDALTFSHVVCVTSKAPEAVLP